jgi:OOP family OmpA-OmpF porin
MLKNKLFVGALILTSVMFSAVASAQVYVGGTVGMSKWNTDCNGTATCDKSGTGYKLLTGYTLNDDFSLEASYFSLGKISATISGNQGYVDAKGSGIGLAGVLNTNLSGDGKFGGFAKLGFARLSTEESGFVFGKSVSAPKTSSHAFFGGLGLSYKISKEFTIRAEIERTRAKLQTETDRVSSFSIGGSYAF